MITEGHLGEAAGPAGQRLGIFGFHFPQGKPFRAPLARPARFYRSRSEQDIYKVAFALPAFARLLNDLQIP
jgi:hypothetical protein